MAKDRTTENNGKRRRSSGYVRPTTGRFEALEDVPTSNATGNLSRDEMDVISDLPGMPPPPTGDMLLDNGQTKTATVVRPAQERLFIATPSVTKGADRQDTGPVEDTVAKQFKIKRRKLVKREEKSWWDRQPTVTRVILIILPAILVGYLVAMILILVLSARAASDTSPRTTGTIFPTNTLPAIIIRPTIPGQQATLTPVAIPTVTPLPTPTLLPTVLATLPPINPTIVNNPTVTPTLRPTSTLAVATTAVVTTTVNVTATVQIAPTATVGANPTVAVATPTPITGNQTSPTVAVITPTSGQTPGTAPNATRPANAATTAPAPPTVPAQPTSNAVTIAPTLQPSPRG
jgi:hypothetical protein